MSRNRLEAFSDGVIAILITIMVLDLKAPAGTDIAALRHTWPVFLCYVLSYIYLGIYWSNHHHLFQLVQRVDGRTLWANLHLLFWLSLIPFVTAWMGEHQFQPLPVSLYGVVLFCAGAAYYVLLRSLLAQHDCDSRLAAAMKDQRKEWLSMIMYATSSGVAWLSVWPACALYVAVAIIWLVPDRRVERVVGRE
jgi:uncharacterized membrane protein